MNAVLEAYIKERKLFTAHVDLTARCPLRCRHCYLGDNPATAELSTDKHLSILDELRGLGAMMLCYSGGEVFLRPDLDELVGGALNRGFGVILKTSGFAAGKDRWRSLLDLGLRRVHVSFLGTDPEMHDRMTRVPGSFAKALDTILFLQDEGVATTAVLTPLHGGEPDPKVFFDKLRALGVKDMQINTVKEVSCSGRPLDEVMPTAEEFELQWEFFCSSMGPDKEPRPLDLNVCLVGRATIFIESDGSVRPCHMFQEKVGDLTRQTLAEIWNGSPLLLHLGELTWASVKGCAECSDRAWCAHCFAISMRDTGDPAIPSPALCEKARAWRRHSRGEKRER